MQTLKAVDKTMLERVQTTLSQQMTNLDAARADFCQRYPQFETTRKLDALRQSDYRRLDDRQHIYLDYTGGGLYGASQVMDHQQMLLDDVYGNPHSSNPTSLAATELNDRARAYVMQYFNASADDYIVIFTSNASGGLRIVGESYPFEQDGQYLLTFDNHNSVNGIREFATRCDAPVHYVPVTPPALRIDGARLREQLQTAIPAGNNLFAFPAQSNFSGTQHALDWIDIAHEHGWDVLVDCAAFAPTNRLDLSQIKPDFVPLSFYKMFGYPTGLGALFIHRRVLPKLRRPWFAGGTITIASVQGNVHYLEEGSAAFEDGTINYLDIPAVEIGLRHMESIGIDVIHERVVALTGYLLDEMMTLRHDSGQPLVHIYGDTANVDRGGTISFNLFDPEGRCLDYEVVETLANAVNISLRTGCFCNPGAGESALSITYDEIAGCLSGVDRITFNEFVQVMTANTDHDAVGAIRVSVGLVTSISDVYAFVQFLSAFLNVPTDAVIFAEN
jgi:molybdenum cofactor sulfurtransferase